MALPQKVHEILLQDAIQRDLTTARRACLVNILLRERFLTREQLITRVEWELGKGSFGDSAWKDTFYRDMRVVKQALSAAGYQMAYRRKPIRPGYYLLGQSSLGSKLADALDGSIAEIDFKQISIFRGLPLARRFNLGCSISDAARNVVAYRIQQRNPELSKDEANRLALIQRKES